MDDLFYFFLSHRQVSSRDERGRKIIGKASIVSLICFGICATLFSQYMQYISIQLSPDGETLILDAFLAVNAIQFIFNITAIVEIVGILVLRRSE